MRIDVITIFPDMFEGPMSVGVVGRAIEAGIAEVHIHDLRMHTHDKHRSVDDSPFGGGPGMVMMPAPLFEAVEALQIGDGVPIILFSPQGRPFTQRDAERLSNNSRLVLLCGRYEGVDERVAEHLATDEVSIGDYILTGGELPALVVIDALIRLLPGVVGQGSDAVSDDSFSSGMLQHPQYTRPADFRGWRVPDVLLSGDHAAIEAWRQREAAQRTQERRPDLLKDA